MILFELDHFGSIIAVATATLKLPNRRRIVFSDGRIAASVQLSAVGSEPCSATNLRRAATDSAIRVSATSDSGTASPSNTPGGFVLCRAQVRANRPAGVSPAPASRQRSGEANSPASAESRATKRERAQRQAATIAHYA